MPTLATSSLSRREFLGAAALPLLSPLGARASPDPKRRLKVVCIYTVLRFRSHAFDFLENFLEPYLFNGKVLDSGMDVISFYADQRVPDIDMTDAVSKRYRIPVFKTIDGALTLGGKELAADAVLLIGEHGEYPLNDLGQKEYPRKRFFDAIVAVMRRSNRFVPLFNDKHLSYRWDWAKEMVDTTGKHRIPFMAGSSVPLAQRRPPLEIQSGAMMEEAVAVHGGNLETYDFHGAEILQSIVEARKGGESGISRVEFVTGDALWNAAQKGRWSIALAQAALNAQYGKEAPNVRKTEGAHAILLDYRDGFKAAVVKIGVSTVRWSVAWKLAGDKTPHATSYYVGPWGNRNLFMALSNAVMHLFRTGQAPYPVERTLLTTGIVEASMRSRHEGKPLPTPHLEFAYQPRDFRAFREMGGSWQRLADFVEQKDIHDFRQLKR